MAAPPFTFSEARNTVYYHNFRVYICGADVTPWITSQITINRADRSGINMASFSLSNAYRAFEMTPQNLNIVVNSTGSGVTTGTPGGSGSFRLTNPYSPAGRYSELAKYNIYKFKSSSTFNTKIAVQTFGPVKTSPNNAQILGSNNNASQATASSTTRFPFTIGSLVFHKYDPVRIFVMDPFHRIDGPTNWTCEFAGYLDTKPFSQNYVSGQSTINITCQDIRMLMQQMRTQLNPAQQTGAENE